MQSYKVEVNDGSGWANNALRWPHTDEGKKAAEHYGSGLFMRWTALKDWRVAESEDAPTEEVAA